jgi:hypothetical protein
VVGVLGFLAAGFEREHLGYSVLLNHWPVLRSVRTLVGATV